MEVIYLSTNELIPYEHNAKQHPDSQVKQIAASIKQFGFRQPIVVDANNVVVIGHGRLLAAKELGLSEVPVVRADDLTEKQIKALRLADNKTNESGWDFTELEAELAELALDFDMSEFGFEDIQPENDGIIENKHEGSLADKYLVPPFSVIYANKPDWLARKRAWVKKGLRSEIGRGGLTFNTRSNPAANLIHGGGTLQSVQEQHKTKQLSKAYADGLIQKREQIRQYGRVVHK